MWQINRNAIKGFRKYPQFMRILAKRGNFERFKNNVAFNSLPNRDSTKKAGKRSPYGACFGNPGNVGIMGDLSFQVVLQYGRKGGNS